MGPDVPSDHTVHILEVGYTADTNHTQKQNDTAQQHEELAQMLVAQGWKVCLHETGGHKLGLHWHHS